MAFDDKRFKMFKWLFNIASRKPTGFKEGYNPYKGNVLCRFGKLYATNVYILAEVQYPEFEHVGDDMWMQVDCHAVNGKHLEKPVFAEAEKHPKNDRLFSDMFIGNSAMYYDSVQPFNPRLIAECMKPFTINGISPVIVMDGAKLEFIGHNKDVSIKVMMMGERY